MTKNWDKFELNAFEFLRDEFSKYSSISFKRHGKSNSKVPDIEVIGKKGTSLFFIDCKYKISQAAQFVVEQDNEQQVFVDSSRNKGNKERRHRIIKHMNQYFKYYAFEGSGSRDLICPKEIISQCIQESFKEKFVEFIISSVHHSDFNNFPLRFTKLSNIDRDFLLTGKYRNKRSGSREIPKSELSEFRNLACKKFKNFEIILEGKKSFITFDKEKEINPYIEGSDYFLSQKNSVSFEIKKRSRTNNKNVIFTLKPKKKLCSTLDDRDHFDEMLRRL